MAMAIELGALEGDKLQAMLDDIEMQLRQPQGAESARHLALLRVLYVIAIELESIARR
jgi:hypothetical protein